MSVVFIDYEEDNPNSKFGSCKHRSASKVTGRGGCCGGHTKMDAFRCELRGIFPLTSQICDQCEVFEKKD